MATAAEARKGPDDEGTINVASKKAAKARPGGFIKLKKATPRQTKPGNWRDGSVADVPWPPTDGADRTVVALHRGQEDEAHRRTGAV
ncbi:hypothetical protein ONZ43_g597 [Nemania bipapillata]|uniref:Uncharacterized protein n=1 Tax=Nemania bipapillata TaxID=110536 RepID=A0ACC2J7U0_9PEZI|nr:hypothetical protein ONZ43_g597 [Nemania bipapillata]